MKIRGALLILLLFIICQAYAGNKRALLIGISSYPAHRTSEQSWSPIHGANDIKLISPTLQKHGFKVVSLTENQATARNIRDRLLKFSNACKSGDIVYIHFSCHGQPVEDQNSDETDGWDESIIPFDAPKRYVPKVYHGQNHITDDELNKSFRKIRSKIGKHGYLTVVVDACHAGTLYRGDESEDSVITRGTNVGFSTQGRKFVPKIDKRGRFLIEKSNTMSDTSIIEACRSYQSNNEIKCNGSYYGPLSYYINLVLKSKSDINWRGRWYEEVVSLMSRDSRLIRQNPVIETSE